MNVFPSRPITQPWAYILAMIGLACAVGEWRRYVLSIAAEPVWVEVADLEVVP